MDPEAHVMVQRHLGFVWRMLSLAGWSEPKWKALRALLRRLPAAPPPRLERGHRTHKGSEELSEIAASRRQAEALQGGGEGSEPLQLPGFLSESTEEYQGAPRQLLRRRQRTIDWADMASGGCLVLARFQRMDQRSLRPVPFGPRAGLGSAAPSFDGNKRSQANPTPACRYRLQGMICVCLLPLPAPRSCSIPPRSLLAAHAHCWVLSRRPR
ncbi:hypothetical protein HPB48_018033 [Haemaphysalis longicornis]|uniref:Uncharacterized protein n=1 Tax=Haemaphysalis longicornis TaxID=44386 RepID=A0A9J6FH86_HAELO|nr:hypothetical protein HPB48_018033 [Haemaphysalis longicornis]